MRIFLIGILFTLFHLTSVHSQFFRHTIIKTKPLQDFVAFNPTLGLEKPISSTFSVEVELMYRNRVWNSTGMEGDFGEFYDGDGFKALLGSRYYFGKPNKYLNSGQKAPFGWLTTLQLAFSYAKTYNIDKPESGSGGYPSYFNSQKRWGNINIGIGKQFYLFQTITLEIIAGPTYRTAFTETFTPVDANNSELEFESYVDGVITIFGVFSIGYFIKYAD